MIGELIGISILIVIFFITIFPLVGRRMKNPTIKLYSLKLARWVSAPTLKLRKRGVEQEEKFLQDIQREIEEIEKKR